MHPSKTTMILKFKQSSYQITIEQNNFFTREVSEIPIVQLRRKLGL